jgi:hypothetical protein
MSLLIAADTTSIGVAAQDLAGSMSSLSLGGVLPAIGEPEADAALGEVAEAFSRCARDLVDASTRGARSLRGFAVAFVSAGG